MMLIYVDAALIIVRINSLILVAFAALKYVHFTVYKGIPDLVVYHPM